MTNEFDIIEHPMVFLWLNEFSKSDPLGFTYLTQGNGKWFSDKWGKPLGKTNRFDYWKKDHLGITLYVYADENSSFYKVQYLGEKDMFVHDTKMGSYLTGFLAKITKEFLNN